MTRLIYLWVLLLLLSDVGFGQTVDEANRLRVVRDRYLANRKSFTKFVCTFSVTTGLAASEAEAIAGQLTESTTKQGRWAVKGTQSRYELLCDENDVKISAPVPINGPAPGRVTSAAVISCSSELLMVNGDELMRLSPILEVVNIFRSAGPDLSKTPFGLGIMGRDEANNPPNEIDRGLVRKGFCRFERTEKLNGVDVAVIATGGTVKSSGGDWIRTTTWWLDPARGFLPLRVQYKQGQEYLRYETRVTSIHQCQNGGFVPARSVSIFYNDASRIPPFHVEIMELKGIELREPTDEELSLTVPAGYTVVNPKDMRSYFTMQKETAVHAKEIGKLLTLCEDYLGRRLRGEDVSKPATDEP